MRSFWNDIKFGIRMLAKNRGFTLIIVMTLALGIGANTALFSVIDALLLRSLPVKNPGELYFVAMGGGNNTNACFSYPIYEKLSKGTQRKSTIFAVSEGTSRRRMTASELGVKETEFIQAQEVTGNFFPVLGISAIAGRTLSPEDDDERNPQPVVVISHAFWKKRFNCDSSIIGKTMTLDDIPLTVIGIAPPGFYGVEIGSSPDAWYPMQNVLNVDANRDPLTHKLSKNVWWLRIMGRVLAGADVHLAQAELDVLYQQYQADEDAKKTEIDQSKKGKSISTLVLLPGGTGWTDLRRQLQQPIFILVTMVILVMLIACANVASLLLARASSRSHEFSIRNALGANRFRLIRQMLTESVMLAMIGGGAGILFAQWGVDLLLFYMQIEKNSVSFNVSPDTRVLLYTFAISVLTGLLSGLPYALRSSRLDINSIIKGSTKSAGTSSSRQTFNRALVVIQLAVSIVLLIGAGLFVRTLVNLEGLDSGFNRENVILFDFDFTKSLNNSTKTTFYKTLLERLEGCPGVQTASLSVIQPLSRAGWTLQVFAEGHTPSPDDKNQGCWGMKVGPNFFKTMGTPILLGREFSNQDESPTNSSSTNKAKTIVINESMAHRLFEKENPIGKQIYMGSNKENIFDIVGVVKDSKYNSLRESSRSIIYMPFFEEPDDWGMTFAVRTMNNPGTIISNIQSIVHDVDSTVHTRNVRTMDDVVNTSLHRERMVADLSGFFSIAALLLSCLGLYGVLSFTVQQRTREIGLRVALGAQRRNVFFLIISQGLKLTLSGLLLGLGAAFAVTRIVSSQLYGLTAVDPETFIVVSLLFTGITFFSCYIPARRAANADPIDALRSE